MKHLVVLLLATLLVGCAKNSAPSVSSPEQVENPTPVESESGAAHRMGGAQGLFTSPQLAGAPGQPLPITPPTPLTSGAPIDSYGVYVVEVASGRLWQVDRGPNMRLSWAADGTLARGTREGLDLIEIEDEKAYRLISGSVSVFSWSPDGRMLAFSPDREGKGTWPWPEGLYLVDQAGQDLREVSTQTGVLTALKWSPSGDYLAWLTRQSEAIVYRSDLNQGSGEQIPGVRDLSSLDFSPDGRTLALAGSEGLMLYNIDKGAVESTAWTVPMVIARWSPTGERILTSSHIAGHRTHMLTVLQSRTLEGTGQIAVTFETATWAPDGERLAYISDGCTSEGWDIWTIRARRDRTRLTHTPDTMKQGVLWSPVNEQIAFGVVDRLMLVDASTAEERTLAVLGAGLSGPLRPLSWSPDGRYLAFYTPDGRGAC